MPLMTLARYVVVQGIVGFALGTPPLLCLLLQSSEACMSANTCHARLECCGICWRVTCRASFGANEGTTATSSSRADCADKCSKRATLHQAARAQLRSQELQ